MGRELPDSKTTKLGAGTDKQQCKHPATALEMGGNKHSHWFTCKDCKGRWERYPVPPQNETPTHSDLLLVGPHAGRTYQQVFQMCNNYVQWAKATANTEYAPREDADQLSRFVQYCTDMETDPSKLPVEEEDVGMEFECVPANSGITREHLCMAPRFDPRLDQ